MAPTSVRWLLLLFLIFAIGALTVAFTTGLFYTNPVPIYVEKPTDALDQHLATLVTSVDHLVSMLMTVTFGLFVLLGFVLRQSLSADHGLGRLQFFFLCTFVLVSFLSVYLGFAARFQSLQLLNNRDNNFLAVQASISQQALAVHVSAILTVLIVALWIHAASKPE